MGRWTYCLRWERVRILECHVRGGPPLTYSCPQCDRVLATEDGLRVHESISHAPAPVAMAAAPASGGVGPPPSSPPSTWAPAPAWAGAPPPSASQRVDGPAVASSGGLATRTVVGLILVNLALALFQWVIVTTTHMPMHRALVMSLILGLLLYGAMAVYVRVRGAELGVVPKRLIGPAPAAAQLGLGIGAGVAIALALLTWAAVGHPLIDARAQILANEPLGLLMLGFIVVAVVAPVVEEMVFRGFLAEAFRERGATTAIVVSAAAFSLAHLQFAEFKYYLLMGMAFGLIYWKRGLVGSVCAHAGFNGALIIVAILAAHGPATVVHADGMALKLPGSWHRAQTSNPAIDVAALGPGEAQLQLTHHDLPAGVSFSLDRLAGEFEAGRLHLPGATLDPSTVHVVQLPVAPAIRIDADVSGRRDEAALFVSGDQLVVLEVLPNGSSQASKDFESMLRSLKAG